jgi:DNA-binding LacI/PurR family transcriptional regulator
VPEELSVIGINDEYGAEWTTPPLTSIHVPVERMIQRGLELLLELMQGATTSHMVELLPEHLVIRETTAPPTAWFSAQS